MKTKENIRLETVQDLVSLVMRRAGSTSTILDRKYMLEDRTSTEWDDPFEGEQYYQERDILEGSRPDGWWSLDANDPAKREYDRKLRELFERIPKTHPVKSWYLAEQGAGYHGEYIDLSSELGEKLDGIWTHRPAYRGSTWMKRIGGMTLQGIAKRLGQTEVGDLVKDAQNAAKKAQEKQIRNRYRESVREACTKLLNEIEAAQKMKVSFGDKAPDAIEYIMYIRSVVDEE